MRVSARLAALLDLLKLSSDPGTPLDVSLQAYFKARRYAGSKDRRFITENLYHLLRQREKLHFLLKQEHLEASPRMFLLVWIAQNHPELWKSLEEWQSTHHAPPLTREEDALFSPINKPIDSEVLPPWVHGNVPEDLYPFFERAFQDRILAELKALNRPAPVDVRINLLKADLQDLSLFCQKLEADKTPLSPWGLRLRKRLPLTALSFYREGYIEVQDEGSQLLTFLAEVRPGQKVLDYCAGGGGKLLNLAVHMKNQGILGAFDLSQRRLGQAKKRAKRAGVTIASFLEDASGLKDFKEQCDRVILDVPCSGTGTWRRNPERRWHLEAADIRTFTKTQAPLLDEGTSYVKKGGRLIYMTCSLLKEENEDQVCAFLERHPNFKQLNCREIAERNLPALVPFCNRTLSLSPVTSNTDGFFAAVFERVDKN